MAKISIIIPIYNSVKYIEKCIYSLLNQTLDDIEIICVDDKGSDGSIDVVRKIQSSIDNSQIIKIIEMPINSGAALARNEGIKVAQGKYLAFVDSDDWCDENMYKLLYEKAEVENVDWCYCNLVKEYDKHRSKPTTQPIVQSGQIQKQTRQHILTHFVSFFWAAIYRKSFIIDNNLLFPAYKFAEDSYFVWMVVMKAERLANVSQCLYHYRIHSSSVSNTFDSTKSNQKIEIFGKLLNVLKQQGLYNDYKEELDFLVIKKGFLIPLCVNALYRSKEYLSHNRAIIRFASTVVPNFSNNKYLKRDFSIRTLLLLFCKTPYLASFIFRLYHRYNNQSVL